MATEVVKSAALTLHRNLWDTALRYDVPMLSDLLPAALERLMDDQAVLARRAMNAGVAQMHRDLQQLYRERLVQTMRML